MALPDDVSTFVLHFGEYYDASGAPAFGGMTGKIKPSRSPIKHTDGSVLVDADVPVRIDAFGVAEVELVHNDHGGGFTYSVVWDVQSRKPSPRNKRIFVPSSYGPTADFDDLGESEDVPGVEVPMNYGKSAYDLAVANGFVGTEDEWLASLVGPMGTSNPTGGAGGALSGTYPNPGLNETALDAAAGALVAGGTGSLAVELRAAFVHLNDEGQLVIVVDGVETTVGGGGGGGLTTEQIQDLVASMILAGTNVTKVYDDAAGTLTLSAAGGGGGTTDPEVVRDTIAAALVAGSGVTITPNDAGDTITISATGGGGSFDSTLTQLYTTTLTSQPATGQPVVALASVTNLAAGWTVILGADLNTAERRTVASVSGNNVTLTANVTGTHPTTEVVAYSNEPIDSDYLTLTTYQQVTGQKRFMAPILSGLASGAGPASVPYALDAFAPIRSRASGGGGIIAVPRAETQPVIDWVNDSTNSGGYLFHLTQSLPAGTNNPGPNGASNGTLIAIGVQGSGGNGILVAKDGPNGNGIYIDQKGVVTNAAAIGLKLDQSSYSAVGMSLVMNEPNAAASMLLSSSGHSPVYQQKHLQWLSGGPSGVGGYLDAQVGAFVGQASFVADSSLNNTYSGFTYRGKGNPSTNLVFIDEQGPQAGGTTDSGPVLRFYTSSSVNPYSGSLRWSKNTQGLLVSAANGAARPGAEAHEALADFSVLSGVRLGLGHDVSIAPLAVPSSVVLSGAGATGGSTTYGYRVAAVNAKGTTIASATVSTAVGQASLSGASPIIVTWAASLGASSYKVYGRTSGSELLLGTVTVPTRTVTDGVMYAAASRTTSADTATTAFDNTVTSASAAFTSADVNSKIVIPGAGYNGYDYYGHIVSVTNSTTVEVSGVIGATTTGKTATISRPTSNVLTSATAAFTINDVGRGVQLPVGSAGATAYGYIQTFVNATTVYLSITATTTITAGTVVITGGTVPLTFTDDGTVTPAGALPGNPAGQTARVTPWVNQTADVAQWQDNAASPVTRVRVGKAGRHVTAPPQTAPVLADLVDGEMTWHLDTTASTITPYARIGGVLKTGPAITLT